MPPGSQADAVHPSPRARRARAARARPTLLALTLGALLALGCVRRGEYDAVVADLQTARDEAHTMSLEAERLRTEARRLEGIAEKDRAAKTDLETKDAELSKNFEDLTLMNTELLNRLKGAGQSVEQLAQERGSLEQALTSTRAQLADWRRQQTALAARAAHQQRLAAALRQPPATPGPELGVRGGLVVLTLPGDLVFEPGSVSVRGAGRPALLQAALALRSVGGRRFRVAAHADAAPAAGRASPPVSPNWQLTSGRALAVVRELIAAGVPAAALSAAAGAEYDPIDTEDTPAARAKNRRIEIVLEPLTDEMGKAKP